MTHDYDAYPTLEVAMSHKYRGHDIRDWEEWRAKHAYPSAAAIPDGADKAMIGRNRDTASLRSKQFLRHLIVADCDQAMLDAIGELANLTRLELEWPTLAGNLSPLTRLAKLRFLSIDSPRKVEDFALLAQLPALRTLMVTNAKHLSDLDWLSGANHLEVIGIEGSINTAQRITSLAPLAGLSGMEAFFGTSLRLIDKDLMPLAQCPRLKFISIARVAKKPVFDALREARPDVTCGWFADRMWGKAGLRAAQAAGHGFCRKRTRGPIIRTERNKEWR